MVDAYVRRNFDVVILDNLSSGKPEHRNPRAQWIRGDITDHGAVTDVFATYGPFAVVNHHAAQKSVTASVADPATDARTNVEGSVILFEAARRFQTPKILFASTGGALYGDDAPVPTPERAPARPQSPYGIAKYAAERYAEFYRSRGLTTHVLRYSNVYGPRQDPHGEAGVVAIFSVQLREGKPMTIYGNGRQTRDFIFVGDVVAANMAATDNDVSNTWNIGTGQETSVNQLARKMIILGKERGSLSASLRHTPPRAGELKRSCLDSARARRDLDWRPRVSLDDGLRRTLTYFFGNTHD